MVSQSAQRAARNAFGPTYDSWLDRVQNHPQDRALDRVHGACDMSKSHSDDEAFLYWIAEAFLECVKRYRGIRYVD